MHNPILCYFGLFHEICIFFFPLSYRFSPFLFSVLFLLKQSWHSLVVLAPSYPSLTPECAPLQTCPPPKAVSFCACWSSLSVEEFFGVSLFCHDFGTQVCRGQTATDGRGAVGSMPRKLNLQRGLKTICAVIAANCKATYEDFLGKP